MNDVRAIGAFLTTAVAIPGSISVATITSSAPGILGVLGFATTTTVALPVAGIVAGVGLASYGIYKGVQMAQSK